MYVNRTFTGDGGAIKRTESYLNATAKPPSVAVLIIPTSSSLDSKFEILSKFSCKKDLKKIEKNAKNEEICLLGTVLVRLHAMRYVRTLQKLRDSHWIIFNDHVWDESCDFFLEKKQNQNDWLRGYGGDLRDVEQNASKKAMAEGLGKGLAFKSMDLNENSRKSMGFEGKSKDGFVKETQNDWLGEKQRDVRDFEDDVSRRLMAEGLGKGLTFKSMDLNENSRTDMGFQESLRDFDGPQSNLNRDASMNSALKTSRKVLLTSKLEENSGSNGKSARPAPSHSTLHTLLALQCHGKELLVISENAEFLQSCAAHGILAMSALDFAKRQRESITDNPDEHKEWTALIDAAAADSTEPVRSLSTVNFIPFDSSQPRFRGTLKCVSARKAYVNDMLVSSAKYRARAIHGDVVEVVEIKNDQFDENVLDSPEDVVGPTTTRKSFAVVSVLDSSKRRNQVVVTLDVHQAETLSSGSSTSAPRNLICVPMDERFPKVCLANTKLGPALIGKRFVVEFTDWPALSFWPNGKYVKTLGQAFDLSTESSAILLETQLDGHENPFSHAALAELPTVDEFHVQLDLGEVDLRNRLVTSIDPIGCQDIDDAISLQPHLDGRPGYELGIHIADVDRFVPSGSALDRQARLRATSVYLQERRLDMLPSILCENLCSLRPNVDRFAVSVLFHVGEDFVVDLKSAVFVRSAIRSRHALAYEQAQRLVDDRDPGEFSTLARGKGWTGLPVPGEHWNWMRQSIRGLMFIARQRQLIRKTRGAVSFESGAEFKFSLDASQKPNAVHGSDHMEIHDTVAELMILANEAAALQMLRTHPTTALLRRHPVSPPARFKTCVEFAISLGYSFDASSNKKVAQSLDELRHRIDEASFKWIENLATRAMSEAEYVCAGAVGAIDAVESPFFHFGLGLDAYTHFTSPIRRYPDIVVARLLLSQETKGVRVKPVAMSIKTIMVQVPAAVLLGNAPVVAAKKKGLFDDLAEENDLFGGLQGDDEAGQNDLNWTKALGGGSPDDAAQPYHDEQDDGLGDLMDWVLDSRKNESLLPTLPLPPMVTAPPAALEFFDEPTAMPSTLNYISFEHAHATPAACQSTCEHVNNRHRSAKAASAMSQALFFSLYFADHPSINPLEAVCYAVKRDGLLCYVPEYDMRVALRLTAESGALSKRDVALWPLEHFAQNEWLDDARATFRAGPTGKDELGLSVPRVWGDAKTVVLTLMSRIRVLISCDLDQTRERFPPPRLPSVKLKMILNPNSEDVLMKGGSSSLLSDVKKHNAKKLSTADIRERGKNVVDEEIEKFMFERMARDGESLYAVMSSSFKILRHHSNAARISKADSIVGRRCFGGYVAKRSIANVENWQEEDEEEGSDEHAIPTSRSASHATAQDMKRMEREAVQRVAKLQAAKFDSRVKRRIKKGAD